MRIDLDNLSTIIVTLYHYTSPLCAEEMFILFILCAECVLSMY